MAKTSVSFLFFFFFLLQTKIKKLESDQPRQTGQVGNSVNPDGGVQAKSADSVYSADSINRRWHTSAWNLNIKHKDLWLIVEQLYMQIWI